jgi:hypothetical protein
MFRHLIRGVTSAAYAALPIVMEGGGCIRNLVTGTTGLTKLAVSAVPNVAGAIGDYVIQYDSWGYQYGSLGTTNNVQLMANDGTMIEFRLYVSSWTASQQLIWKSDTAYCMIYSDGTFRYSNGGASSDTAAGVITTGQWYHIVMIFNGVPGRYSLWINGTRYKDKVSMLKSDAAGSLCLGNTQNDSRLYGYVEEFVYRRGLVGTTDDSFISIYGTSFTPPTTVRNENEVGWADYFYISPRSATQIAVTGGGTIRDVSATRIQIVTYTGTSTTHAGSLGDYVTKLNDYHSSGSYQLTQTMVLGSNRAMEFRFKIDSWDSRAAHQIFRMTSTAFIQINSDGSITLGNYNSTITSAAGLVQLGQWYHLAHSYTHIGNLNSVWLDGTRIINAQALSYQTWLDRIRMGGDSANTTFKDYVEEFICYSTNTVFSGATITVPTAVHNKFDPNVKYYVTARNA